MRREAVPNGDTAELEGGQMELAFNRWTIVERARVSVQIRIRVRSEKRGRNDGVIRNLLSLLLGKKQTKGLDRFQRLDG